FTGNWGSFQTLFADAGVTSALHKNRFQQWFIIDAADEPEAFWLDDNTNNVIDINTADDSKNELYHRFKLNRFTDSNSNGVFDFTDSNSNGVFDSGEPSEPNLWDTLTIDNVIGVSPAFPVAADEFDGADPNTDGNCIPYLKNWTEQGNWVTLLARKKQIAANLIDYCDSDIIPKTDGVASSYTAATYIGLDKTPYINDVKLRFGTGTQPNVTKVYSAPNYTYAWLAIPLNVQVEVANIHGADYTSLLGPLYWSYSINGTINYGTAVPYPLTANTDTYNNSGVTPLYNWNTINTANLRSYKRTNNITLESTCFGAGNYLTPIDIEPRNFTITSVSLKLWLTNSSGNLIDYAEVDSGGGV
ncbi:MAG: hypothetical protein Q8O19_05265, partial [Rectinemataceae bacterium]|nr:hypothetical protein [Rectinemataceae bacterium]